MKEMFDLMNSVQEKRLDELVKSIVEKFNPLVILCYATNFRVDVAVSCFSELRLIELCDYELLTVTEPLGNSEAELQKFVSGIYRSGSVTILNLNKEDMFKAVKSQNVYITTILKVGTVLYIADGFDVYLPESIDLF